MTGRGSRRQPSGRRFSTPPRSGPAGRVGPFSEFVGSYECQIPLARENANSSLTPISQIRMPPRVDSLRESSHRVVRLVALGHLADAAAARDRLSRGSDEEALHDFRVALRRFRSWERAFRKYTRDDFSKKRRRQLRDLARDTGASRDLEVHLSWLAEQRGSATRRQRPGLKWLVATLEDQKAEADAVLERDVDRRFTRLRSRLEKALKSYTERIELRNGGRPLPAESFAAALVRRVVEQSTELHDHISRVHSLADETEAHEARIAAKRLRYLLEPIAKLVPGADALVDRLKSLQDVLGDLHDAHVFGAEVDRLATGRERAKVEVASHGNGTGPETAAASPVPDIVETTVPDPPSLEPNPPFVAAPPAAVTESAAPGPVPSAPDAPPAVVCESAAILPAVATAAHQSESSAPRAAAGPRPPADPGPGLAAVRHLLRDRADAAFSRFTLEWSGDASAAFFRDVDAVATAITDSGRAADVEIERKFLLRALPEEARRGRRADIDQGYVPGERLHERIRRVTSRGRKGPHYVRFYRTVKLGEGVTRTEVEEETTEAIFETMWPLTRGRRLRKRRYSVDVDGKTWELDEFRQRDLVLAELELDSEDESITFPSWLEPFVEREVTLEPEYQNINLAR